MSKGPDLLCSIESLVFAGVNKPQSLCRVLIFQGKTMADQVAPEYAIMRFSVITVLSFFYLPEIQSIF